MKYEVVLIILYDREKRFLLQHRTQDAQILPGYWAFFGGSIHPGETPDEAVRRETQEELDYALVSPRIFKEQPFTEGGRKGYMYVYIDTLKLDKSCLELREGQGWGWYKADEVAQLKMIERDRRMVREIAGFLEQDALRAEKTPV